MRFSRASSARRLRRPGPEAGFMTPMLLVTVLALLLLVGGAIQVSSGKAAQTTEELAQERAFQAAEAGIDYACFLINAGTLVPNQTYTVTIGADLRYVMSATDMPVDGIDNDNDGSVDEADETGFAVTSRGEFRSTRRRLLAWVRKPTLMPTLDAVVTCTDPAASMAASGTSFSVAGVDFNPDGTPGPGTPIRGTAIASPGTVGSMLGSLSIFQKLKISGAGGVPSATVTAPLDLGALADALRPVAQNVIKPGNYTSVSSFGSAAADDWRISWCPGSLTLGGGASGAGVLIVDGNLDLVGNANFSGLVLVRGNVSSSGGGSELAIKGALMLDGNLLINGGVDFIYSSLALTKAANLMTRFAVLGWRELSR